MLIIYQNRDLAVKRAFSGDAGAREGWRSSELFLLGVTSVKHVESWVHVQVACGLLNRRQLRQRYDE